MSIPCQTYLDHGKLIQGTMDTTAKFNLMIQGIDLKGKRFLDVGCNTGMMSYLAHQRGAIVKGIDIDNDTINQARLLYPGLSFFCENAEKVSEDVDIILASAVLHYTNLERIMNQFSRCSSLVICDIWLHPSQVPIYALTTRGIYIPSMPTFLNIVNKYFESVDLKGPSLSPDDSERFIFHLSKPTPSFPEALLISGDGNKGKTTLSYNYNRPTLHLDQMTHEWLFYHQKILQSVSQAAALISGLYQQDYLDFYHLQLSNWLKINKHRDIVIEGFSLLDPIIYNLVIECLSTWNVKEIKL